MDLHLKADDSHWNAGHSYPLRPVSAPSGETLKTFSGSGPSDEECGTTQPSATSDAPSSGCHWRNCSVWWPPPFCSRGAKGIGKLPLPGLPGPLPAPAASPPLMAPVQPFGFARPTAVLGAWDDE